jgi:hypothetical protein
MIDSTRKQLITRYSSADGQEFKLIDVWVQEPESDIWVKYQNIKTQQEYTCREEAFLERFYPMAD